MEPHLELQPPALSLRPCPVFPSRNTRQDPAFPGVTSPLHPSPSREGFAGCGGDPKGVLILLGPPALPWGRVRALSSTGIRRFWDLSGKKSHFSSAEGGRGIFVLRATGRRI